MKAFVTSIGESTTELCIWALERNGFEVELIAGTDSLVDKLEIIYEMADDDFVRVDADVVVNKGLTPSMIDFIRRNHESDWWIQFSTFGWFTQGCIYGGVQYIRKEALPILRKHVAEFRHNDRPETELSRVEEFYNPRRFSSLDKIAGIHGFAQSDIQRVIDQKKKREYFDSYDFELAIKLEALLK